MPGTGTPPKKKPKKIRVTVRRRTGNKQGVKGVNRGKKGGRIESGAYDY